MNFTKEILKNKGFLPDEHGNYSRAPKSGERIGAPNPPKADRKGVGRPILVQTEKEVSQALERFKQPLNASRATKEVICGEIVPMSQNFRSRTKYTFYVTPMGAPRMSSSDRWKKRPVTTRYWQLKAEMLRLAAEMDFVLPDKFEAEFHFPTAIKGLWGKPHQAKPDKDNCEKILGDFFKKNDCSIWDTHTKKLWAEVGKIIIYTD